MNEKVNFNKYTEFYLVANLILQFGV